MIARVVCAGLTCSALLAFANCGGVPCAQTRAEPVVQRVYVGYSRHNTAKIEYSLYLLGDSFRITWNAFTGTGQSELGSGAYRIEPRTGDLVLQFARLAEPASAVDQVLQRSNGGFVLEIHSTDVEGLADTDAVLLMPRQPPLGGAQVRCVRKPVPLARGRRGPSGGTPRAGRRHGNGRRIEEA